MNSTRMGILHPGAMGSTVGAAALANIADVTWISQGRSGSTAARAAAARLKDMGTLEELVRHSDVIVSVCPPHAAEDVAGQVADLRFGGVYVDANAVSPERTRRIAAIAKSGGADFVDGGIVGPPARRRGTTRLYLSGPSSGFVSRCFANGPLEAVVLEGPVGAASALKMAYAAYTKGVTALTAAILAVATREGVLTALQREWDISQPGYTRQANTRTQESAPKAWRFVGEMQEIAATFANAGLPSGFHEAAAEVYRRLEKYRDCTELPSAEKLAAELLGNVATGHGS